MPTSLASRKSIPGSGNHVLDSCVSARLILSWLISGRILSFSSWKAVSLETKPLPSCHGKLSQVSRAVLHHPVFKRKPPGLPTDTATIDPQANWFPCLCCNVDTDIERCYLLITRAALELHKYLLCSSTLHQLSQSRKENLITAGWMDGMLWLAGTPEGGMELGDRYHGRTIDPSVSSQDGLIWGVSLVSTYRWH